MQMNISQELASIRAENQEMKQYVKNILVLLQQSENNLAKMREENQEIKNQLRLLTSLTRANSPFLNSDEKAIAFKDYENAILQNENVNQNSAQFR